MQNLFGEDLEELKKKEQEEALALKKAELEKKKLEAEAKKAEADRLKAEKKEKCSYTFTTVGDVKKAISDALDEIAESDSQFKEKYLKEKMDICYSWLVDQIKNAYTKANGNHNGGTDISNEQCIMACKHFFNEELWKYFDEPKKVENKKSKTKEDKDKSEQLSLNLDFEDKTEEQDDEEE